MKTFKQKRWTSLLVALMMTVYMVAPGLSTIAQAAGETKTFDLIEISDFHGTLLDTYTPPNQVGAVLVDRIKKVKAANPDRTLIMAGGDLYQGSAISNMLTGVPVQKVLSNMGLEVTALGNHEFDWSLDKVLNTTMKDATYGITCANLYNKNDGTRVFNPYKVFTKDGLRIAVIGAISNETPSIVLPGNIANYNFTDAATEINAVAKEIKDGNKADVVIALIHEGDNRDGKTGPIFEIAKNLTNVNAVFGGHSHTIVTGKAENGIPVYIPNCNGKGFMDVKMSVTDGVVTFPAPSAADYVALDNANGYKTATPVVDAEAKAIIDAANALVTPITSEVIGHNTGAVLTRTQILNGTGKFGESYLGNWCTDVMKAKVNADVAMTNNGGLRCDIPVGDITVGSMWQFAPFDNTIVVIPMSKAQIKAVLEDAVKDGGKGIQLSGIKFSYDPAAASGNRVFNITRENGNAISNSEILNVATNDFLATGGDGFGSFVNAGGKNPALDTHILVRDILIDGIRANISKDPSIATVMNGRIVSGTAPVASSISVIATSDVHGNVLNYDYATANAPSKGMGLAKVSTYVKNLRDTNANVMLVDNGDTIQGTALVYYYNMIDTTTFYPMAAVMGNMGYDTWTLGNHEFNYGLETLGRVMTDAKSKNIHMLAANAYKEDGSNFAEPYYIKTFNVNGVAKKVAVIGLTNKCIPNWEDPAHYAGLHFNDLVDEAKKWVSTVKNEGADVVILSAHSGEEGAADAIPENQIKAIAQSVSGVDAIIAGHAHATLNDLALKNPDGKVVPVVEPSKYATLASKIDITFDENGSAVIKTSNVAMDNTIGEDPAIKTLIKPYHEKTLQYIATKIGTSTGAFTGEGQNVKPTAIMELVNKVQKEGAGTELSIAAPLSDKAYIPSGDVTIKDVMSVYVFENFLFGVKMTGKQVKDWMEYAVSPYKQVTNANDGITTTNPNFPAYNLDQLYGASYDVDLTEAPCTLDKTTGHVVSGNRIKNLKVNGKLVKDTDVFTVAINNYRFNGGGGFVKAAGMNVPGRDNTDPSLVVYDSAKALGDDGQVRSMMMKYIQTHGTISPDCSSNWKLYTTAVTQGTDNTNPTNPTNPTQPTQPTQPTNPTLPKTGSPVDMVVLLSLGATIAGLGALVYVMEERKRKENAA